MPRPSDSTEELILAAYLARDLPNELHKNVESYLLEFPDATELVTLASSALEAVSYVPGEAHGVEKGVVGALSLYDDLDDDAPKGSPPSKKSEISLSWSILAFCTSLLVLAISSSVYVGAHDSPVPVARLIAGYGEWSANVEVDAGKVSWEAIPDASSYVVFIIIPETLQVVNMVRTKRTNVSDLGAVANAFGSNSGRRLELWVVAFDAADGFIQSSVRSSFYAP